MKKMLLLFIVLFPLIGLGQTLIRWEQIKPISAQVEKTVINVNDWLLLEDSQAGGLRKKIKISNIIKDTSVTNEIQYLDTAAVVNDTLQLSLSGDGQPIKEINLKPYVSCNYATQTLSSTSDTLVVSAGVNAILDISGNTTIRIEPTATCNTGNITVICDAAGYTLTFVGGTMKFSPYVDSTAGVITTTATAGAYDIYSWWSDGTRIFINGTKAYE